MPYVNIQVTREGVSSDQKKRLIVGVTQLLTDVLGKLPQTTHVVIQEIETDNWGGWRPASHQTSQTPIKQTDSLLIMTTKTMPVSFHKTRVADINIFHREAGD